MRRVERQAVNVSLSNLITFPWVKRRVEEGGLTLHGWLFDLEAGALLGYEADFGWQTLTG